jgi:hypothetical protein
LPPLIEQQSCNPSAEAMVPYPINGHHVALTSTSSVCSISDSPNATTTTPPPQSVTESNVSRHSSAASLKQMNASQLNVELDYAELTTPTPISPANAQRPKFSAAAVSPASIKSRHSSSTTTRAGGGGDTTPLRLTDDSCDYVQIDVQRTHNKMATTVGKQ